MKGKRPCGPSWTTVVERSEHARRTGALRPIRTRRYFVEDQGVRFLVHLAAGPEGKTAASTYKGSGRRNPFLPYDEDLFVADVSETHVALLNKFSVLNEHLLIVTRAFEEQEMPLTRDDFAALTACMAEYDALGFYNSGEIAGASQRHKHLQMVPLPLAPERDRLPIETRIASGLPFRHALAGLDADADPLEKYRSLLERVGLDPGRPAPYNLLVTREWMLLVPRSREAFAGISLNALGFAGSLFVRRESELALLREVGPLAVLIGVT